MPRGSVVDRPSGPPGSGGANRLLAGPDAGHGWGGRDWNSPCGCSIRSMSNCVSAAPGRRTSAAGQRAGTRRAASEPARPGAGSRAAGCLAGAARGAANQKRAAGAGSLAPRARAAASTPGRRRTGRREAAAGCAAGTPAAAKAGILLRVTGWLPWAAWPGKGSTRRGSHRLPARDAKARPGFHGVPAPRAPGTIHTSHNHPFRVSQQANPVCLPPAIQTRGLAVGLRESPPPVRTKFSRNL